MDTAVEEPIAVQLPDPEPIAVQLPSAQEPVAVKVPVTGPNWLDRYKALDTPEGQVKNSLREIQRYLPPAERKAPEEIEGLSGKALSDLYAHQHAVGSKIADDTIRAGGGTSAIEGSPDNPFFQMAHERMMESARQYAKENPHAADNAPLARGISGLAGRAVDIVTGNANNPDTQRRHDMEKALSQAYGEQDPYGQAISGAAGKLLSPEMVASMLVAGGSPGTSVGAGLAREVGTFTTAQTLEQGMQGEQMTPLKNAAGNAAMVYAARAAGEAAQSFGGGLPTVTAKAVGGALGNTAVTVGQNSFEGRKTTGPEAAAAAVSGLAPAIAEASADLFSRGYAEHVRAIMKQNPGISVEDAHALANEIVRTDEAKATAQQPVAVSETPTAPPETVIEPIAVKAESENNNASDVRINPEQPREQGNTPQVGEDAGGENLQRQAEEKPVVAEAQQPPQGGSAPESTGDDAGKVEAVRTFKTAEVGTGQPQGLTGEVGDVPPNHLLLKPIIGKKGFKIIGYHWASTMEEGMFKDRRVSDWERAGTSTGTGRSIVHHYYVQHPDGKVTIEGIGSAEKLLGIGESRLQTLAKNEQLRQKYKMESDKKELASIEKSASDTVAAATKKYREINYSPMRTPEDNDQIVASSVAYEKDGKFIRTLPNTDKVRMLEAAGWKPVDKAGPEVVTQTLYRETSPQSAHEILKADKAIRTETAPPEVHFANSKDLALGQGENRGVHLEFEPGFKTTEKTSKPGAALVGGQGLKELVASPTQKELRQNLRAIEVPKAIAAADPLSRNAGLARELKRLEAEGWVRKDVGENVRFEKPAEDKLQGRTSLLEGPGGSTGSDKSFREQTSIAELANRIAAQSKPTDNVADEMSRAQQLVDQVKGAPSKVGNQLAKLRAGMGALVKAYASEPPKGDFEQSVRRWSGADNRSALEIEQFKKIARAKVPDANDRAAVTIYLESGGDQAKLAEWAKAIKENPKLAKYRRVFDRAANLPESLRNVADDTSLHHQAVLDEAVKAGILKDGLENYIMHVWKDSDAKRKIAGEASFNSLITNPSFTKQRTIPTYFEGIQKGFTPESLDFADLTGAHERSFREALAARAFIKELMKGKAADGRPLATISAASAREVEKPGADSAYLIKPNMKPDDPNADYRTIDHPALRGWKWAAEVDGKPVFVQGDMQVHPDIYQHVKNNLTKSAIQQWAVNVGGKTIHPGEIALRANSELKHLILSLSGFHQTTLGVHALEHRTKPFGMPELDMSDPTQKSLVDHGLMVAHYNGAEAFDEGVSGGGIIAKVPGIGPKYQAYVDYLFKSYLPRIKMAMAKNALARNTELYKGKLSDDQILNLSADQANAAFGGVNLRVLGRSKTFQDIARLVLMAPDFLEARGRFVGQAAKPYGREQLTALVIGALGMYTVTKMLNAALSKDHDPRLLDPNPFSVHVGDKDYAFRTIQGDIADALEDPMRFVRNRFSPVMRFAAESAAGKDQYGKQQGFKGRLAKAAKDEVPIPLQPWVQHADESPVAKTVESVLKIVGVNQKSTAKEDRQAGESATAGVLRSPDTAAPARKELQDKAKAGEISPAKFSQLMTRGNYASDEAYTLSKLSAAEAVKFLEQNPGSKGKSLYIKGTGTYGQLVKNKVEGAEGLKPGEREALRRRLGSAR